MMSLTIFLSLLFFYCLVSRLIERTILTAPIVFTLAGMLVFVSYPRILETGLNEEVLFHLAEIGLVLLLFTDASRTDLNLLRRIGNLPARLLSVGMLLTIFLGAVTARLIFLTSPFGKQEFSRPSLRRPTPGLDRLSWRAHGFQSPSGKPST